MTMMTMVRLAAVAIVPLAGYAQMGKLVDNQQPAATTPAQKPATKPNAATSTPAAVGIPKNAVKIDEATWRYQEPAANGKPGKIWLYRKNPFGITKIEESEAKRIGAAVQQTEVPVAKVTDLGDSYRFERSGPFGSTIWTKKKSELNAEETKMVSQSGASPVTQKAGN